MWRVHIIPLPMTLELMAALLQSLKPEVEQLMSRRIPVVSIIQREVNVILRVPFMCFFCKGSLEVVPLPGNFQWQFQKIRNSEWPWPAASPWMLESRSTFVFQWAKMMSFVAQRRHSKFWTVARKAGRVLATNACSPMNAGCRCPIYNIWYILYILIGVCYVSNSIQFYYIILHTNCNRYQTIIYQFWWGPQSQTQNEHMEQQRHTET